MVKHLASLASDRLIISFAPKTVAYSVLKRIGELFPGPSKVTIRLFASSTFTCLQEYHKVMKSAGPYSGCLPVLVCVLTLPDQYIHCHVTRLELSLV